MEENQIKDIVFCPQSFSLHDIKTMAADVATQEQLVSIFGDQLLKRILNSEEKSDIFTGGLYETDLTSNLVVFWGMPHSGRTSAIFSLLSKKGFRILPPQSESQKSRIKQIINIFKSQKALFIPDLSKNDVSEIYHAQYKSWLFWKSYNISFFKPQNDFNQYEVLNVLNSHSEQIHVFCLDCGKDNKATSYLEDQVQYHEEVINFLEKKGLLQQCNAIYLLVTKSDLMNVPDIYEENAAQTFVTSGMPEFWHKIKEVCYAKNIYDAQPIAFSIGNFILKDFTRIDADYSKIFLEESVLPKCQPNPNCWERLLSKGKTKYIPYIIILILCLVGFGVFYVWNAIVPPPEQKVTVFSYANYFINKEKGIKGLAFEKAANLYQTLRTDLNVEKSLRLTQGAKVLADSISQKCDSALTNDFSVILMKELSGLFSSKKWTRNETLLRKRDRQVTELISHPTLKATAIKDYHIYINNYFNIIKPIISKSTKCTSVKEVRNVVSQASQWKKHPYNKDTQLYNKLLDVKINAYRSCADYYQRKANKNIRDYNIEIIKTNNQLSWSINLEYRNKVKQNFQRNNEKLEEDINKLISDIRSTNDSRLVSIKKALEQTKNSLVSIYK